MNVLLMIPLYDVFFNDIHFYQGINFPVLAVIVRFSQHALLGNYCEYWGNSLWNDAISIAWYYNRHIPEMFEAQFECFNHCLLGCYVEFSVLT